MGEEISPERMIIDVLPQPLGSEDSDESVGDISEQNITRSNLKGYTTQKFCFFAHQLKFNSELYHFFMEVDRRRIKAANRSASKHRKSARKDLTSLREETEEQNSCLEGQRYGTGIAG